MFELPLRVPVSGPTADPRTHEQQSVDGILLSEREPCMLIQPPAVLVRHAIAVQNVQRNHTDFVRIAKRDGMRLSRRDGANVRT